MANKTAHCFGVILFAFIASSCSAEQDAIRDCADCPELVRIPAGEFLMGSTPEEAVEEGLGSQSASDESPQHKVVFATSFALSKYEITKAQFAAFVTATDYEISGGCMVYNDKNWKTDRASGWQNPGFAQTDNDPAVCISWDDAQAYIAWLSDHAGQDYRLPSESEWEYAVRAGTTSIRFWGDRNEDACDYANIPDIVGADQFGWAKNDTELFMCDDGGATTMPVGSYRPNDFGLHDMMGNAWEWVADCYYAGYEDAPADGSAWTKEGCNAHVMRGGAWYIFPRDTRSANRYRMPPRGRMGYTGFRIARSLP